MDTHIAELLISSIDADIAQRKVQIARIREELKVLRIARKYIAEDQRRKKPKPITLGDRCVKLMTEYGALSVKMAKELLNQQGVRATRSGVDCCLRLDAQKRFVPRGKDTYGLRVRPLLNLSVAEKLLPGNK